MKAKIIFSVLLFLIILTQPIYAESHTGEVDLQLSQSESDYGLSDVTYGVGSLSIYQFKYKGVGVAGYPKQIKYHDAYISKQAAYSWVDIPQNVGGSFVLTDGGNFAGSGTISIHRVNHVDSGRVDITFDFYNNPPDFVANLSETNMDVSLYGSALSEYYSSFVLDNTVSAYNTQNVEFGLYDSVHYGMFTSWAEGADSYVSYDYYGHFINEYNITLSGATASTAITRDGLGQQLSSSRLKLKNSTGSIVYLPSSYSTTNSTHNHDNGLYYYYLDVENYGDVLIYNGMGSAPPHSGAIEFNQTHYTDPEIMGVEYDIISMDTANYEYWVEVMGDNGGTSLGVNAEYIELTDSSGQVNYTVEKQWLTLPMNIQSFLYAYKKVTGTTVTLAQSEIVIYNPTSTAPGSVWTNKESYNTTEIVTIYTDTENGGKLKVDKRDDPLYDWYSIYSGLSNVKMAMQTSYVGTWDVYLYEDSILTNQTVFTVLADEDTAYFNWWETPIYKGEPASYDYIATSSNSIVRIYDGTGNKLYEFNATEGYNTGQITTTTGTVGNWTGSLYDNGTYYNSSLEVEASNSWVRFDRTDYYLEDTIQIEYFIVSQDHAIVLRDADNKIVLKWMPGTFMTGQRGTLDYTLIEDNEWGHDVQTQLWNGYIAAGLWYIGYEDINYLVGYPDSYDEATVHNCYDSDRIGGGGGATQGDGSIIGEFTSIAELAGFRGEVGLFILSILIIIITSAAMLISKFPVPGVLCIDILQFFAFIGIGFIPILYLILFGVVAGLIVFGTIFFKKAG